jgi:leader peptidase (prepilin peptidase)/N-methyltransferase
MGAAFVVFVPSLALGSFLNVVAARVPKRLSIVRPASACMACSTEIRWYDNVPIVSYLVLRGRCRSCGARFGLQYPAVELLTALLLTGCALKFGLTGRAAVAGLFCVVLVVLAAIDF